MADRSLVTHRQTQHGVAKGRLGPESDEAAGGNEPRTYRMVFPAKAGPRHCPVEGFIVQDFTRKLMKAHF